MPESPAALKNIFEAIATVTGQEPVSAEEQDILPISEEIKREQEETAIRTKKNMAIGTVVEDGCIYAGISPDTLQPMYVTPDDEIGLKNYSQAIAYAKLLSGMTGQDYRIPTKNELTQIFNHRAKLGNFKTYYSGLHYRSSTLSGPRMSWGVSFATGMQTKNMHHDDNHVIRCVRS